MSYRITVSLPCFGRPERTKRSIQNIMDQDINGWEAFIMGDGCADFQKLIDSGWLEEKANEASARGNKIIYFNQPENKGGCGYSLTNYAIQNTTGKYFIFFANDDVIFKNHFRNYLSGIENTDYDFVYYDSWIVPAEGPRIASLAYCHIGHSELIIKTDFLKTMPPHSPEYGHDWHLISEMMKKGKYTKGLSQEQTYRVMRTGVHPTLDNMD